MVLIVIMCAVAPCQAKQASSAVRVRREAQFVSDEDAALLGHFTGTVFSRNFTLSGAEPVREVEKVDKGLHVSPRQDVLADCSPVHALELLLRHLLLTVVAAAIAGATTREACRRRVLLLGCSQVPRVGGRTVAQP